MIYTLPFLFAILNRARGSGILNDWLSRIAKVFTPFIIFILFFTVCYDTVFQYTIILFSYLLGESMGWGKWVATICDRTPRYDEEEGHTVTNLFGIPINFWDGIHHIANFIVKEKDDFLNYSRIALSIRGVYWWLPVLVSLMYFGQINWIQGILALWGLAISFPISFELGRLIDVKFLESRWEKGEIIYGFFQGLIFMGLTLSHLLPQI